MAKPTKTGTLGDPYSDDEIELSSGRSYEDKVKARKARAGQSAVLPFGPEADEPEPEKP